MLKAFGGEGGAGFVLKVCGTNSMLATKLAESYVLKSYFESDCGW